MWNRKRWILFAGSWLAVTLVAERLATWPLMGQSDTGGIGVTFNLKAQDVNLKGYVVEGIAPGGPADQVAGLREGDVIIAVDGRMAAAMGSDEFIKVVRGAVGTRVELTFFSASERRLRTIQLVRGDIAALARAMPQQPARPAAGTRPSEVVGTWRVYSSRLFYDRGGGGTVNTNVAGTLELSPDGTWSFSASRGTWSVAAASSEDWKRWMVEPYGPKRKLVLTGWNNGTADGPIEESNRVDFLWVLYRVGPPTVGAPGTVHMKFGRQNP